MRSGRLSVGRSLPLALALTAGVCAWVLSGAPSRVEAEVSFTRVSHEGGIEAWDAHVLVGGLSNATLELRSSCECATVEELGRTATGRSELVVKARLRVKIDEMDDGVRPGLWVLVDGAPLRLASPGGSR